MKTYWLQLTCCTMLLVCGCKSEDGGPTTYPVNGVVSQKGAPVADADVIFVPDSEGALAAFGKTDSTGTYKVNAVAGSYKIKLSKLEKPKSAGSGKVYSSTDEELEVYAPTDGDKVQVPKNLVPKKFTDHNTSGLTHRVPTSPTTFDIELN